MIDTIYLEIIILLLMVYIIDTKILPQIIIMFLTISMMLHEITISTDLKGALGTIVLFGAVVLYSALQISLTRKDEV
jgi:hypothetical protein